MKAQVRKRSTRTLSSRRVTVGPDCGDLHGQGNYAIQKAIDSLPKSGGVVEILPGRYCCAAPVHLRSAVTLRGTPGETFLCRAQGFYSPLAIDADYWQTKVTVTDPSGFRAGMGVYISDDESSGWDDSVSSVVGVEGNVLRLDLPLIHDYKSSKGAKVIGDCALISGIDVEDTTVSGIVMEGADIPGILLGGCRTGGLYLHRAKRCTVQDCSVFNFAGDGFSMQVTQDIVVRNCVAQGCMNFGFHPGTGSARMHVSGCHFDQNKRGGIFVCWRVQESIFEEITCDTNGEFGLSIGHRDSNNSFSRCSFRANGRCGIRFREEEAQNGAHCNRWNACAIENNGECGIEYHPHSTQNHFVGCAIQDAAEQLKILTERAKFSF